VFIDENDGAFTSSRKGNGALLSLGRSARLSLEVWTRTGPVMTRVEQQTSTA
jgi:hypothetical protein